jgi:hypothetical protein
VKVQIDSAEAGEYRYSVDAVRVPFSNFPYVVTVGVKQ